MSGDAAAHATRDHLGVLIAAGQKRWQGLLIDARPYVRVARVTEGGGSHSDGGGEPQGEPQGLLRGQ
jgi:hypothetical protein